jgi:hypothetical protein
LPRNTVDNWVGNTNSFAMTSCANCPKPLPPPCLAQFPRCVSNHCTFGPPG